MLVYVCDEKAGAQNDEKKDRKGEGDIEKGRKCSPLPVKYLRSLLWNSDAVRDRPVSALCVCMRVCVCVRAFGFCRETGQLVWTNSAVSEREHFQCLFIYLGERRRQKKKRGRERGEKRKGLEGERWRERGWPGCHKPLDRRTQCALPHVNEREPAKDNHLCVVCVLMRVHPCVALCLFMDVGFAQVLEFTKK